MYPLPARSCEFCSSFCWNYFKLNRRAKTDEILRRWLLLAFQRHIVQNKKYAFGVKSLTVLTLNSTSGSETFPVMLTCVCAATAQKIQKLKLSWLQPQWRLRGLPCRAPPVFVIIFLFYSASSAQLTVNPWSASPAWRSSTARSSKRTAKSSAGLRYSLLSIRKKTRPLKRSHGTERSTVLTSVPWGRSSINGG